MITYTFPNQNKVFLQNNRTDTYPLGNLWSTFNIDLESNVGVIRVSPRLQVVTSTASNADLGCPVAFKYFDTKIWSICDTRIFSNSGTPSASFTEDSSTGFQTNYSADESDLELFNNTLCATTTNGLYSKANNQSGTGAWTSRDSLSTSTTHVMTYFKNFNRLYYSNSESNVISINTSWVTADPVSDYSLKLLSVKEFISTLDSTSTNIFIGTINREDYGGFGSLLQWDGISAQVTYSFKLKAQGCMASVILNETPYIMDSNGVLSYLNGYSLEEVGRLPFGNIQPYNVADIDNERFIHPNGMYVTKNNTIRMVINNRVNSGNIIENMSSGIWEWSKDKGIVHISSFTYNPSGTSTITDFGQNRISRVGALSSMNTPGQANGSLMAGATYYTDASTSTNAIFSDNLNDTVQKKGYFVSDWVESDDLEEEWERLWPHFRKLLNSSDSIVFKYRTIDETPTYFDLTWVNTTSFTTTTDISSYWTSGYGGEVEVLRGTGGGSCSHITNISESGGTYTVTIDTVITGVTTGSGSARVQSWTKCLPEIVPTTSANVIGKEYANISFGAGQQSGARVQIKCCMTFTGKDEFRGLKVTSHSNKKIT